MSTLIAFAATIFLLAAATGKGYPQSWYQRWTRHM
jgi:hypothetical protein